MDGSFAEYVHLAQHSTTVSLGDHVEAGQRIAASGNTGWTTGPHLHFAVYVPTKQGRKTVETKFVKNESAIYLKVNDRF